MRAIVIGSDGLIGKALSAALSSEGGRVWSTTRRQDQVVEGSVGYLDLAIGPWNVGPESAEVGFICAAMTSIAECRRYPEQARLINTAGPVNVARSFVERGIKPIYLSTNAVFACTEPAMAADRPKMPTSVYGKLKSEAEDDILGLSPNAMVVRLTKVLTVTPLLTNWWGRLGERQSIDAASDHRMAPITLSHVVDSLARLAVRGAGGIYQLSATSDVSYAEVAHRMADRLGVSRDLVSPKTGCELGIPESDVLHYTSLEAQRAAGDTGIQTPDPYVAVDEAIEDLSKPS